MISQFPLNQFKQEISDSIDRQANEIGVKVVAVAFQLAPVRTGELRRSITYHYDNHDHTIDFIVGSPYGMFQEFGTRHMRPHPYLRPALNKIFGRTGGIYGFETSMEFANTIQTDKKLLAHGGDFQMHKSLSDKQKAHVRKHLAPVSKKYFKGGQSNVGRAHIRTHRRRHDF